MAKIFTSLLYFGLFAVMLTLASMVYFIYYYSDNLPDYRQLENYNPPAVTRFYTSSGKLLEQYAKENRIFTQYNDIPPIIIGAFLAAEDKNFFDHPGIDFIGVARAIGHNLLNFKKNKGLVGGSTITQQVVKNMLLSNEKSYARKIKEAILSFRISQVYSKERILELYLNQIYLGKGAYGITAAALSYFGKPLDELKLEEVAFLAALPKAPSSYDPNNNYNRSLERRNYVLDRMLEDGYIDAAKAETARLEPIVLNKRSADSSFKADYFAEAVRQEISTQFGESMLYEAGLTVKTTLNEDLQKFAENALRKGIIDYDRKRGYRGPIAHITLENAIDKLYQINYQNTDIYELAVVLKTSKDKVSIKTKAGHEGEIGLKTSLWAKTNLQSMKDILKDGDVVLIEKIIEKNGKNYLLAQIPEVNGAMVIMQPHTGKVLALVGGFNYNINKFNRATQARRQPGSLFKTFVYLSAFENGIAPNHIMVDEEIELDQGRSMESWKPKNYNGIFMGPMTLRTSLEKSRNTIVVKLSQKLGIKKIKDVAKRFGITNRPPDNFAVALGAAETTPLKMTNAYNILASQGHKVEPNMIEYIQDVYGRLHYKRETKHCTACELTEHEDINNPYLKEGNNKEIVIDARTAYQITDILAGAIQRGTGRRAKVLGPYIAGKTGTTNESNDAWFVGYSHNLVAGVYIGYDTPRSLGKNASGSTIALPIFVDFMQNALKLHPAKPFDIPEGLIFRDIHIDTGKLATDETPKAKIIREVFKNKVDIEELIDEELFDIKLQSKDMIEEMPIDNEISGMGAYY